MTQRAVHPSKLGFWKIVDHGVQEAHETLGNPKSGRGRDKKRIVRRRHHVGVEVAVNSTRGRKRTRWASKASLDRAQDTYGDGGWSSPSLSIHFNCEHLFGQRGSLVGDLNPTSDLRTLPSFLDVIRRPHPVVLKRLKRLW